MKVKKLIIHCSDSEWGSVADIRAWHIQRGWDDVGYHYIIMNGVPASDKAYYRDRDGLVQKGRFDDVMGAHCRGQNHHSLGICLIGKTSFTPQQILVALPELLIKLMKEHDLTVNDVKGHYEFSDKKICPGFDMNLFRDYLRKYGRE